MPSNKGEGLVDKFEVKRLTESSRGIDHSDCFYFVLDPKHDPLAEDALWEYANRARMAGFDQLADDLEQKLGQINLNALEEDGG